MRLLVLLLCWKFLWSLNQLSCQAKVVKVAIIHRHGNRPPDLPSSLDDPFSDLSQWSAAWNQLTLNGMKRMYHLGQFLAKRYSSLWSGDTNEVLVQSSQRKRCLMSTQCLVSGAFPPDVNHTIVSGLKWQPIAVFMNSSMLRESLPCPEFDREREMLREVGQEAQFNRENQQFYNFFSNVSGMPAKNAHDVYNVHDRLMLAQRRNLTLPSWATDELMASMKRIAIKDLYFRGVSWKQRRLRTGMLWGDIINRFENESGSHKFLIYSTHDGFMTILLQTLGYVYQDLLDFGATFIIELHQETETESPFLKTVKVFLIEDALNPVPREFTLSGCEEESKCDFSVLKDLVQPLFSNLHWKEECGLK